jgi:hypothetical protein
MIVPTEFLIAIGAALVVAIGIKLWRAERARARAPIGKNDILMKRAEAYQDRSAFLKKAVRDYKANRHLSERRLEEVEKALERVEKTKV